MQTDMLFYRSTRLVTALLLLSLITTSAWQESWAQSRIVLNLGACQLENVVGSRPSGVTYDPVRREFAVVDALSNTLTRVRGTPALSAPPCDSLASVDLRALGVRTAGGIAYRTDLEEYAVLDAFARDVFFVSREGQLLGTCDLEAIGGLVPQGITFDGSRRELMVVDDDDDEALRISDAVRDGSACALASRTDIGALVTRPTGVTYLADEDQFAISDPDRNQVVFLTAADFQFAGAMLIDTVSPTLRTGLAYDVSLRALRVVDPISRRLDAIDARGVSEPRCAVNTLPQLTADGIAAIEARDELVVVDGLFEAQDVAHVLDGQTCEPVRSLPLNALGIDDAKSVDYLAERNELVIANAPSNGPSSLFFIDYDTGVVNSSCSLEALAYEEVRGLAAIEALEWIVLQHEAEDVLLVVDTECNFVAQDAFSIAIPGDTGALAFLPGTGRFLALLGAADEASSFELEGARQFTFDTGRFGLRSLFGATALEGGDAFLVVNRNNAITRWTIPRFAEPTTVSGSFAGAGVELFLLARADGQLSGRAQLPSGPTPVFGFFDRETLRLTLSLRLPAGAAITLDGLATADLETLELPPPIGPLDRVR